MAKKQKEEKMLLKDAIKLYGDRKGVILIHKYGIHGDFEYKVSEISDKLLNSEIIVVQKHTGGVKYNYDAITYIIK